MDHPKNVSVSECGRALRARALGLLLGTCRGPISHVYGFDRGTPVDRPWIEGWLEQHACDIRGRVLEVKDDAYARRFGADRVTSVDVLDIDAANEQATIVADLSVPGALSPDTYDSIVLTQVLQFLDPATAVPALYRALSPGGVLLLSTSVLCRLETADSDLWRLPPAGLRWILDRCLPAQAEVTVDGRGDAAAAAAFVLGLSREDLRRRSAVPDDWRFPVVALARVRRPTTPA